MYTLTTTELKSEMNKFIGTLLFVRSLREIALEQVHVARATHTIPFAWALD